MLPSDGVLQTVAVRLYKVPIGKRAELRNIVLVNSGTTPVTVNLYANVSGVLRPVFPVGAESLSISHGRSAVELMPFLLATGNEIWGAASAAGVMTYVIFGIEVADK